MPLSRAQKEKIVSGATETLRSARMVIFSDFKGMNVAKSSVFRRRVKKTGGGYRVVKKTLARIALKNAGLPADALAGYKEMLGVATHVSEDSMLAKLFLQAAKEFPGLKVSGGIFEGKHITAASVLELAKLPSREELLARLAGTLVAPLTGFARVLHAPLAGFITVVKILAEKNNS